MYCFEGEQDKHKPEKPEKTEKQEKPEKQEKQTPSPPPSLTIIPNESNCSICMESMNNHSNVIITKCGHSFHSSCILKMSDKTDTYTCPICRSNLIYKPIGSIQDLYDALADKFTDFELFQAFVFEEISYKYVSRIDGFDSEDETIYNKVRDAIMDYFDENE
jgi:transcription elongation factor Elf1